MPPNRIFIEVEPDTYSVKEETINKLRAYDRDMVFNSYRPIRSYFHQRDGHTEWFLMIFYA